MDWTVNWWHQRNEWVTSYSFSCDHFIHSFIVRVVIKLINRSIAAINRHPRHIGSRLLSFKRDRLNNWNLGKGKDRLIHIRYIYWENQFDGIVCIHWSKITFIRVRKQVTKMDRCYIFLLVYIREKSWLVCLIACIWCCWPEC